MSLATRTYLPIGIRYDPSHGRHLQFAEATPEKEPSDQLLDDKEHGTTAASAAVIQFQFVSLNPTFMP